MTDSSQFVVRRLDAGEAQTFRTLRLEALKKEPRSYTSSYADESIQNLEWFRQELIESYIFVAEVDGVPQGIAALTRKTASTRRHVGAVWAVYVRREARNAGAASNMIKAIIDCARTLGLEQLELTVSAGNNSAASVYIRHGFLQYGLQPRAAKINGEYVDEMLFSKNLTV